MTYGTFHVHLNFRLMVHFHINAHIYLPIFVDLSYLRLKLCENIPKSFRGATFF